ncbi:hypothetical protein DYB25_001854 [Aphanomyces astaci]|uniref:Myb/SANT-like domain-containing protein n=1 Tax=Aphanomyces astaci TaxID=112090 RepID=A0A397ARG9_APHAT|nr:hypothetical protein DYB25_001854 [Aphanomyces astaci]
MDDGRASWDDEKDFTWMKEMIHQVHVLGKRANSRFKREAWHAATTKLNSDRCQLHERTSQVEKRRDEEAIRAGFTDYEDVRRRNIRFEEYASTGAVTNVVVASTLERVAPSKAPARFAASSSHKDNDAYLAAFDSDPRLPRLNAQAENDDPSTAKAVSPPLPALLAPSTKASAAIDGSARAPWLRGPSDPSGRVDSVSSQPLTCISLAPGGSEVVVGSCDHALYIIPLQRQPSKARGGGSSGVRTLYSKTSGHGEWVTAVAHLPGPMEYALHASWL